MSFADRVAQMAADECRLDVDDREAFAKWLDRKPPTQEHAKRLSFGWREWFDVEGNYLGTSSSRSKPDDVGSQQPCRCSQCSRETR